MKRIGVFLIAIMSATALLGCSSNTESQEEIPQTTEQIIEAEISDYSALSLSELEVLGYDGDPEAMYELGLRYEYGTEEVKQDFAKAMDWYSQAADLDHAPSKCALGYFYLTATSVGRDLDRAAEYFESAIELGNINAKVGLARTKLAMLTDEELTEITEYYNSNPTEEADETDDEATPAEPAPSIQKSNEIFSLVKEAEATGDIDGIYFMGYLYQKGIGVRADAVKARNLFLKVAASDSTELLDQYVINLANTELGLMYMDSESELYDEATAFTYFEAAADNGFAKANYYIGQIYENGLGVDKDYEKALDYYLEAAESDYAPALNQIGYLYYNGYGVDVDFSSAVYYQKLAALQGYAPAQVNLGFLYENGFGVERNLETALSYYELAAEANYEGASEAVVRVRAQMNEEI